jgi:hypothetical protein
VNQQLGRLPIFGRHRLWADCSGCRSHREKTPGGGPAGKGVRNRIEAGGADCPSVSSGIAVSGESVIGGFFGGLATICGRCSLRADLSCFFDVLLASFFGGFSGETAGVASGANTPRSLGSFSDSTHRRMVSLSSSMAAHPARPKHAETDAEMSATRAQTRIDNLAVGFVAGDSLVCLSRRNEDGTVWLPHS